MATKRETELIGKIEGEVRKLSKELKAKLVPPNLVSLKEAARQLATSEAHVKRLIASGKIRTTPAVTMHELQRFVDRLMREQHPKKRKK